MDKLPAPSRYGVKIFLSIRDGNATKNMPLFTAGNPEEASRLIQVCPCLPPSLPDEPEHRGVSLVLVFHPLSWSLFSSFLLSAITD